MTTETSITLRAGPKYFMELSGIEKFNDGSGYTSRLSVSSGHFSCSEYPFYFDDLKAFTENITQAYDKVEGKARLGHMFEKDFIEISVLSNGHVITTGLVAQHGPSYQELRFSFECDQTFLPELSRSLRQVAKDFEI